jgi:hypothetical protein
VDVSYALCTAPFGFAVPIVAVPSSTPTFTLLGAWPNPMRASGTIGFVIGEGTPRVRVQVFDVAGRLVRDFGEAALAPGEHHVHWDGQADAGVRVRNGIYFVRITTDGDGQGATKLLVAR